MDAQNLQLFLSGPSGSARSDVWLDHAELIEADDRVCRKLVWLPPESDVTSSATMFLRRTFVAKPWASATKKTVPRLDQMSAIDLPPGWRAVLENEALDADAIVALIVEAQT